MTENENIDENVENDPLVFVMEREDRTEKESDEDPLVFRLSTEDETEQDPDELPDLYHAHVIYEGAPINCREEIHNLYRAELHNFDIHHPEKYIRDYDPSIYPGDGPLECINECFTFDEIMEMKEYFSKDYDSYFMYNKIKFPLPNNIRPAICRIPGRETDHWLFVDWSIGDGEGPFSFSVWHCRDIEDYDEDRTRHYMSTDLLLESMKDELTTLVRRYRKVKSGRYFDSRISENTNTIERHFSRDFLELLKRIISQEHSSIHIDIDGMDSREDNDRNITGETGTIGKEKQVWELPKLTIKVMPCGKRISGK